MSYKAIEGPLGGRGQSVQRESNPHVDLGAIARGRYIMDAVGYRTSRRSHELPESNRLLNTESN